MPKISRFWRVFENSVTRQVSFNKTKFVENAKIKIKCNILNYFQTMWSGLFFGLFSSFSVLLQTKYIACNDEFQTTFFSQFLFFIFQGNYFLFIELSSQLHRTLLPIPVWIYYLMDNTEKIPSKILGVILIAAYMVFKGKSIMTQFVACKSAAAKLLQSTVSYSKMH